jgi:hypothetical protein
LTLKGDANESQRQKIVDVLLQLYSKDGLEIPPEPTLPPTTTTTTSVRLLFWDFLLFFLCDKHHPFFLANENNKRSVVIVVVTYHLSNIDRHYSIGRDVSEDAWCVGMSVRQRLCRLDVDVCRVGSRTWQTLCIEQQYIKLCFLFFVFILIVFL